MAKTVLITVSSKLYADGLRMLIGDQLRVVGEAPDGRSAARLTKELLPDVVILEVIPETGSVEATRQIVHDSPGIQVLGISDSSDSNTVVRMLQAGACGYVLASDGCDELQRAIASIVSGHIFLSASVQTDVINICIDQIKMKQAHHTLTAREQQVLKLLAEGKTMKQLADVLFISVKTAETHRKHIMEKLKCQGIADLVRYAIKEGVVSL